MLAQALPMVMAALNSAAATEQALGGLSQVAAQGRSGQPGQTSSNTSATCPMYGPDLLPLNDGTAAAAVPIVAFFTILDSCMT